MTGDRKSTDAVQTLAMAVFTLGILALAARAQSPPGAAGPRAEEAAGAGPAGGSESPRDGSSEPKRKDRERRRGFGGASPGGGLSGFGGAASGGGTAGGGMMMGSMDGISGMSGTGMGMLGRGDTASLLERALRYSPDVQLAEAKLRTAEAELNRARLEVAKSVIGLEHSIASQQRIIELERVRVQQARESHKRLEDLVKKRLTPASSESTASLALKEAESELIAAEARLSELRETMRYMMGGALPGMPPGMPGAGGMSMPSGGRRYDDGFFIQLTPGGPVSPSGGQSSGSQSAGPSSSQSGGAAGPSGSQSAAETIKPPAVAASGAGFAGAGTRWAVKLPTDDSPQGNLRRKLQSPTQIQVKDSDARDVAKYLQELHGIAVLTDPGVDRGGPISIDIRDVALHAALQAIEDTNPGVRFFVRDYGLLIGPADDEALADRSVRVRDFVHSPPLGVAIKYELGPEGLIPTETTDPNTKPPAKDSKSPGPAKPADSKPDAPNQGATKPAVGPAKTPEKASKP